MNRSLLVEFTPEEIHITIKQMHPTKALGSDSMNAIFFHKFWHIISEDVIKFFLSCLNGEENLHDVNYTNIVLIPKVKNPRNIPQYRPISLCNVIYKTIAKVPVNRIKLILPACISKLQSAFVPGTLITDNVLVAYELLHTLKIRERQGEFVCI